MQNLCAYVDEFCMITGMGEGGEGGVWQTRGRWPGPWVRGWPAALAQW